MDNKAAAQLADCFSCVHFVITWDRARPRACRLFGFKSAGLPSRMVFQSTGEICKGFIQKEALDKSPTK